VLLAELIALTWFLELSKGKRINIYTRSKRAFVILHVHAAIWRERHFLTATGSPIKYNREIVYLPPEVAVKTAGVIGRG
jgi:hypothetical protein